MLSSLHERDDERAVEGKYDHDDRHGHDLAYYHFILVTSI
jgi:hypothetical protein